MDEEKGVGTLYVCATPVGNLDDITLRVLDTLKKVDLIAAEDTRESIKLLNHFEIKTPMTSYHEHNKYDKARELKGKMLAGLNVALITDAGTPCISDPGEELVRQCYEAGIKVTPLPGPCALIAGLSASGLPTRRFCFEAFLPAEKKERNRILGELKEETRTIILYEAPHHLASTLEDLLKTLGPGREITLCRELTKVHEEIKRTTLKEAVEFYSRTDARGEYVLVIEGKNTEEGLKEEYQAWEEVPLADHVRFYEEQGFDKKEAMRKAAKDRGISRRDVYNSITVKKEDN